MRPTEHGERLGPALETLYLLKMPSTFFLSPRSSEAFDISLDSGKPGYDSTSKPYSGAGLALRNTKTSLFVFFWFA